MPKYVTTCKAGDLLIADGGFTCIPEGTRCRVREDADSLYVSCQGPNLEEPIKGGRRRHRHYLDGQLNEADEYVGFYRAEGGAPSE